METGERIRAVRVERGLTQKQLGDLCGMADSAIRRYESGRGNPTEKTLKRIASALGVPLADLLPEPTEEEKAGLLGIVQEIGLPHGNGTVAETKALLRRVAEMYGEKSVVLLRLTSIMSDAGVDKVIEYTKSIFQEYMDESIPRAGERSQNAPQSTPAPQEGKDTTPAPDAPETASEGE